MELIGDIERIALEIIERHPSEKDFIFLEGDPIIEIIMDKPLWAPTQKPTFIDKLIEIGKDELELKGLFNQFFIDESELKGRIHSFLLYYPQITLQEVIEKFPIGKGISELIVYFKIAAEDNKHIINDKTQVNIIVENKLITNKLCFEIKIPQIIFVK